MSGLLQWSNYSTVLKINKNKKIPAPPPRPVPSLNKSTVVWTIIVQLLKIP